MSTVDGYTPWADGEKAPIGSVSDEALVRRLRTYKRSIAKRYRVADPDEIERTLGAGRFLISPKLDGELWFLIKRASEVFLAAYNGRALRGTSLCREAEAALVGGDVILAGELVATPTGEERPRSHHVGTALGDPALEPSLSFHAFDLVDDEGEDALLADYERRLERMRAHLEERPRVRVIETLEGDAKEALARYREWVVSDRYEGIVVRTERGLTFKIKSSLTLDAVVLAFGERITGDVHQVRELNVGLLREDGSYQLIGAVGNGFSEQDRAAWHARLAPMEVPSRFRLANREGTLCKFVRPEVVVEVRCSDLLTLDSLDRPIRRMCLAWGDEGYRPLGEAPTAVMIHPIFLRERADKEVDVANIGLDQLTRHVTIETERADARVEALEAEVVARGVYTKETKGLVSVRKYLLLDTHDAEGQTRPPFLAFFTDYSPSRKDPLQTALRSASSRAGAEEAIRAWLRDNLKRGWSEEESARVGAAFTPTEPDPPAKTKRAASPKKKG